ncbi:Erg29 [Kluyveromyces lactis]|nr:Erg29 [Kluyveromyces lactis]
MEELRTIVLRHYLQLESIMIAWIRKVNFLKQYTDDPLSARITLFLVVMGGFALVNELYITIQMSALQMDTWEQLNSTKLDEDFIRNHRFIHDDSYHATEWFDEKSGLIIEEFESREKFFAKPVHVAHIYVRCQVIDEDTKKLLLDNPITFHIEFSPEEFENEKRPEFGCTLRLLKSKLYHFFKDGHFYDQFKQPKKTFTITKNVKIYNTMSEELPKNLDDIQLCFLKMETGDTIDCEFLV